MVLPSWGVAREVQGRIARGHCQHQELGGKGLFRPRMHPAPMFASIPCLHTAIQGACVSLGGPGHMLSFSDVREKLLQSRYKTQSVVCAIMWQLESTPPWYALTYWPYVDTTHRQSKQHPTNRGCNMTVTFRQGLYWLGYGWSSAWLNCLILWNLCDITSYPKGRLVE